MDARENQTKCSRRWILRRRLELCLAFAVLVILFSSLWMGMTLQNQSEQSSLSIPLPIKTKNNSLPILQRQEELKIIDQLQPPTDKNIAPAQANNLWDNNPSIPDWMKEYFDWHTQQLSKINETNWKSFKYFILSCKKSYERCGGVSDRLKPVPLLILSASRSQRLFFIHWEKVKFLRVSVGFCSKQFVSHGVAPLIFPTALQSRRISCSS